MPRCSKQQQSFGNGIKDGHKSTMSSVVSQDTNYIDPEDDEAVRSKVLANEIELRVRSSALMTLPWGLIRGPGLGTSTRSIAPVPL